MNRSANHKSREGFSWLAYGFLSLSMLVIAAVSATVGQDKAPNDNLGSMGGGVGISGGTELVMGLGMFGMGEAALKRDRDEIRAFLDSAIIMSLQPEIFSRRAMPQPGYWYAIRLHVDDQSVENLVRFEVTRSGQGKKEAVNGVGSGMNLNEMQLGIAETLAPAKIVVATGVLQVDSATIYIESPTTGAMKSLRPLSLQHLANMKDFKVTPAETSLAAAATKSKKKRN